MITFINDKHPAKDYSGNIFSVRKSKHRFKFRRICPSPTREMSMTEMRNIKGDIVLVCPRLWGSPTQSKVESYLLRDEASENLKLTWISREEYRLACHESN